MPAAHLSGDTKSTSTKRARTAFKQNPQKRRNRSSEKTLGGPEAISDFFIYKEPEGYF